jgi:TRAP-type mannitol/chloroaromatic compound transport system permease large subunit
MAWLGVLMFASALALMILTGLPLYAVLIGVASGFALIGVASGSIGVALLSALSQRLVGLLEHDLLQALPLYAFIGALLNRLPLATLLQRAGEQIFRRSAAAPELAALGVGALLAPMNGSVGASLHTLARSIAPALAERGTPPARAAATVCVASTLGIVIPPSLVLLLLGDAMMQAHTQAANVTRYAGRIVNTQDVMRAALVPGLLVLAMALLWVAWRSRGAVVPARAAVPTRDMIGAGLAAAVIVALLASVALGLLYAVEAAASGGVLLLTYAAVSGQLRGGVLRLVLADAMTLTGLLLALLVAATTFSLILRSFETDLLVSRGLASLASRPMLMLGCVLAGLVACSFVLDAFEMVFLVVPLVMPAVLVAVSDPAWVAAMTLLVLQAGFLLPPFGYAVVMSRSMIARAATLPALARALRPHLLMQAALILAVLTWPQITRWTRPVEPPAPNRDSIGARSGLGAAAQPVQQRHHDDDREGADERRLLQHFQVGEKPLDRMAEQVAGAGHRDRPDGRADHVEDDKAPAGNGAHADHDRADEAQAIHEADADDQERRMTIDQAAHARGRQLVARPAPEQRLTEATTDQEADLIAQGAADKGDENDDRKGEIAAMRGDAGQQEQRLPLEQAAGEQGKVPVLREKLGQRHAGVFQEPRKSAREAMRRAPQGASAWSLPL